MKHSKHIKKLLWGLVLLLGTISTLNALFKWYRPPFLSVHPLEAIPHESSFIIEGNAADHLFEIKDDPIGIQQLLVAGFVEKYNWLKTQFPLLYRKHSSPNICIALEKTGPQSLGALFSIDLNSLDDTTLLELKSAVEKVARVHNYEGIRYYSLELPKGQEIAYYRYRNLLIASEYPLLIELAIRQLNDYGTNLFKEAQFVAVQSEAASDNNSLYINFSRLPRFLQAFVNYKDQDVLKAFSKLTEWMRIDLASEQGGRIEGSYAPLIKARRSANKKPQHLLDSWGPIIPDNIGLVTIQYAIDTLNSKNKSYHEYVSPWFTEQWGLAIANPRTTADRLLFLQAKDAELMEHYLAKYGERNGLLEDIDYQTYQIKKVMDAYFLAPFNQELKLKMKQPYYTIINDYVVFANKRLSLESLIDKHIVGQTMQNNIAFQQFAESANQADAGIFYVDAKAMYPFIRSMLKRESLPYLKENYQPSNSQWKGGWTATGNESRVSFRMQVVQTNQVKSEKPKLAWRVALQDEILIAPQGFWNPQKSINEILVQDKSHQLYLLSESGELLWKKRLDGPILSDIHQVDYQEDGQMQYLFNTAGKIYLIGEEGRSVGNYPLSLHSRATNGLCLTKFKHGYAYQFFIACENGHAYGFTKDGNPIPGWNPKYDIGAVTTAFQYFQKPGRDYILVLNTKGVLFAYNSAGKKIFKTKKRGSGDWKEMEIIRAGKQKVIALTDHKGGLNIVNHRGKIDQFYIEDATPGNYRVSFVNHTERAQNVVALSKDHINYYRYQNRRLIKEFALDLAETPDELFKVATPTTFQKYFGTLDLDENQINLYSAESGLCNGFPLPGNTKFDLYIASNGQESLLTTGLYNEVFTYQLTLNPEN